jgi:MFS family permease
MYQSAIKTLQTWGRLGDQFGRKRIFIAGVLVFVAGSIMVGGSSASRQKRSATRASTWPASSWPPSAWARSCSA